LFSTQKEESALDGIQYQVSYIRIGVSDLQQSLAFYEEIMRLSLISQNIKEGYLLFTLSGITLIIEKSNEDDELCPCRYLGISLKVRDIFQVYEYFLSQGVKFMHSPEKQFWGGYLTEFNDPDGNVWTLLG
jgi:catechol 2,3-dioxygenase-like lactoylglutathione lyase family enzyme